MQRVAHINTLRNKAIRYFLYAFLSSVREGSKNILTKPPSKEIIKAPSSKAISAHDWEKMAFCILHVVITLLSVVPPC